MTLEEALEAVDAALAHHRNKPLSDLERVVFQGSWEGLTYLAMMQAFGWSEKTLKDAGACLWKQLSQALGEPVKKTDFKAALVRVQASLAIATISLPDWGDAVDASCFFGRADELTRLEQWVVNERCRLVAVLGIGGIGKTALTVKLAEQVQPQCERLIWRSLRNTPPVEVLLADLLQSLSGGQEHLASTLDGKIAQLLQHFRDRACLMILDNWEPLLQAGDRTGAYQPGYEGYGQLLETIADAAHQSCLVITSRERPGHLTVREGRLSAVRVLQLTGLSTADGQQIMQGINSFYGDAADWLLLNQYYSGNPLALRIVAPVIERFFNCNLTPFLASLQQQTCVFQGVRQLLDHQFERLEGLEKSVMYWMAIMREPISVQELQAELVPAVSQVDLFETMTSLQGRSLCIDIKFQETNNPATPRFTQQPVVMQYVVDRLIAQVFEEIRVGKLVLLSSHALIQAQAKDYVRDSQVRVILQPFVERLQSWCAGSEVMVKKLNDVLAQIRKQPFSLNYAAGNLINLMHHLKFDLTGYDFSGVTVWQADLRNMNLHRLNFARADLSKSVFAETVGYIFEVAFSPDGAYLATCDAASEVSLWQVATGKKLWTRKQHKGWVMSLAFSPDGYSLASSGCDPNVRLWAVNTGDCLQILESPSNHLQRISFSPDGTLLASCSLDQTARLWDVATGQCVHQWQWSTHSSLSAILFTSVTFSPSGDVLACCTFDYTVHLWDVQTRNLVKTLPSPARIGRTIFTPEGRLVAGCDDGSIRVWNVQTGALLQTLTGHHEQILGLAVSPDGRVIASGSVDYTIRLWDSRTGDCLRVLQGDDSAVWSLTFSSVVKNLPLTPDGTALISYTLASGHEDRGIKFWDTHSGQCFRTLQGQGGWINSTVFSLVDSTLATTSFDQTVRLWDIQTQQCIQTLRGHTSWIWNTAFSPDGLRLASAGRDGTARLWHVQTGECLNILRGHTGWVWAVAFSPDGRLLATCSYDKTIKLWDAKSGECLKTLLGHTSLVRSVAFCCDGQTIASGGYENTVRIWNILTGECLHILTEHSSWISMVAFSPDGCLLASSSDDRTIRVWNVETGQCVQVLKGSVSTVLSVSFSSDGRWLAGGSASEALRVWNVSSGECMRVLEDAIHAGFCDFNRDGKILAGARTDEAINLWDVDTGECLQVLRYTQPYEEMKITGAIGLTEAQRITLRILGAVEV